MADQKKSRKHGRNKEWCTVYRSRARRERNKALKMLRHATLNPNDEQATHAIHRLRLSGNEGAWRDAVRAYIAVRHGSHLANHDANLVDKVTA